MSSYVITVNTDRLIDKLNLVPQKLHARVLAIMNRLSIQLQSNVKSEKLSGQVLHVRSGTLRRSINRLVIDGGSKIEAQVGTNVVYAAIHEYGFTGTENVRAYLRRTKGQVKSDMKAHGPKWGRLPGYRSDFQAGDMVQVRAHDRHMVMPKRSFLRSALAEMEGRIRSDLGDAFKEIAPEVNK